MKVYFIIFDLTTGSFAERGNPSY